MSNKPRIIITGFAGLLMAGGVTWDYLQYPLGFRALGWDVLYLEDTQMWPIYQTGTEGADCSRNVAYLSSAMDEFDLGGRWAYRDEVSGQCFGISESALLEYCKTADVFLNISCSSALRDEYLQIPIRGLVDTDPMFTQIQYLSGRTCTGDYSVMRKLVDGHSHYFTFGEKVGQRCCLVPDLGLHWRATRQPIVLLYWPVSDPPEDGKHFYTTVMNWTAAKKVEFNSQTWGQKDVEFMRFLNLPQRVPGISLGIAVGQTTGDAFPLERVRKAGWAVLDPATFASDARTYRDFIVGSRGEFSVAKETYVKANTGWFSCRSACYLASGRPVVTQDTAWSDILPNGCGLHTFHDEDSAVESLKRIEADLQKNARAARSIAEDFFDSNKVLSDMLSYMGV